MRPLTLILAVGLAALPFAGAARAASEADLEQARKHAAQAKVHYDLGEFGKAAEEYILVYRIRPLPALLFNIAQSYRQAGEYDKARQFYESYLRENPEAESSAQVRKALKEIDELQAKEKLAKAIPPTGVKQPPDTSLPSQSGAQAPPKAEPAKAPVALVPPKALPAAAVIPNVATTTRSPSASEGSGTRTAAWIAGGAAVALLGGGALFTAKAASTDSALSGGGHTRAEADDLISQSSSQHRAGALLLGAGLAAAGTCAVLFLLP